MRVSAGPRQTYLVHKAEIDEAIGRVLDSGNYILGPEVEEFEREFAAYIGASSVVGVGSGTEALHLALRACGITAGDAVVTVSHTAVATVAAIELMGAVPLLIDVDSSYTMSPHLLEETLASDSSRRIKAVIPVHLYGHPADMPAITDIAARFGVQVIEDCAQSHGATIDGRMTGTWGEAAAFSFYPTKNLAALGDGGAVVCSEPMAERVRLLRQYGWRQKFLSESQGTNSRLDELQAAILRVNLKYLDQENRQRRHWASVYERALPATVACPAVSPGVEHVFHLYVISTQDRDELRDHLSRESIPTSVHYPVPVHRQPAYAGRIEVGTGGLRNTERLCGRILSLPMHPYLEQESVDYITSAICDRYSEEVR